MAELTFAMDALTYLAAGLVDRHDDDMILETAAAKLFCSEALWKVVDDAVQIWGGEGYMREHGLERALRDARINRIVEGTTEVMTSFVALMGMKAVGEQLEDVVRAIRHPIANLDRLTGFARHEWSDILVGNSFNHLAGDLSAEGRTLAGLTRRLAREVERLLPRPPPEHPGHAAPAGAGGLVGCRSLRHGRCAQQAPAALSSIERDVRRPVAAARSADRPPLLSSCRVPHRRRLDQLSANDDAEVLAVADALLGLDEVP